jgi:hypothetical protein
MSPYSTPLQPIDSVKAYFTDLPDGSKIFTGKRLEVRIPAGFAKYGMLSVGEFVTTLGMCDLIIDDTYHVGLNILGQISIYPSDMGKFSYQGIDYITLFLNNNDVFISNTRIIQDSNVVYCVWSEFITAGKIPYYWTYSSLLAIFQHVRELTGQGIGVSRSVFEGIIAHISRDRNNISKQYRLTDMSEPFKLIALKSISQGPTGTIARLNGSYSSDGLTSALRYEVDQPQPFENILRGVSSAMSNQANDIEA